jgi:hypothetical protein
VTEEAARVALMLAKFRGTPFVLWLGPDWKRALIVYGAEDK